RVEIGVEFDGETVGNALVSDAASAVSECRQSGLRVLDHESDAVGGKALMADLEGEGGGESAGYRLFDVEPCRTNTRLHVLSKTEHVANLMRPVLHRVQREIRDRAEVGV